MSEDNKNIGMNMTNKNYLDEEVEDSEESTSNIDIYKYTNKGKVHEFNLGLLTPQERKKFDKMSNKERQRFIASVELQQMPSMFDEISLKSVVYPDPDSNIGDVQAAAAKYNELVKLEEDPKFKQMVQGYLKFDEAQKYILKYCPHISQNDIDLLLKLKPDITVYQFINYYKNIMNDKNLVELNNIQKQLKNPYSDDVLKKILNRGEQLSKGILKKIIDNDVGELRRLRDAMKEFKSKSKKGEEKKLDNEVANILGIKNTVKYSDYNQQQFKEFNLLYSVLNNLVEDVKTRCDSLAPTLTGMGMKITSTDLFEGVLCKKEAYDALISYIRENEYDQLLKCIPGLGIDRSNPTTQARMKEQNEKRTQDEKDEKDKERRERLEERRKKDEEMRKQYELTMPREDQSVNVDPMNEDGEAFESIEPSTYPVLSEDVINEINDTNNTSNIPQILDYNYDPTKATVELKPVDKAKDELWSAILKRDREIEKECNTRGDKYLNPGYMVGVQPVKGSIVHLFSRYQNGKLYMANYDRSKMYETIKHAVKNGEELELIQKALEKSQSSKRISIGKYLNQEIIDAMKKAIDLGGSIFSRIKNTFKAPEEIKETKMKLSELSEKTIQNNKSLRELEKTIAELTERVNELSKQVGKSYVDRKISNPSFLDEITKPHPLKPVEKPITQPIPQENPDSMEAQMRRKLEERRKDLEPDYSEESEEEWGEGVGGKIKIQSSDAKKPIPMSDFFKKYL